MKKSYLFLLLLHVLLVNIAYGQKLIERPDGKRMTRAEIDKIVKQLSESGEVTGLCLGIINNNKPVYIKAYGYKNKGQKRMNDTATCFYAASLAKPLFAYIVMQLVDRGLIDLDKPISQYLPNSLPEYDNYKDLAGDERWKLITPRYCLDHTTGFPNWRQFNPRDNNKLEIFFTPGSRYAYSGEGIYLLQLVVETVTGKKLEQLAEENIFQPFGMRLTSFLWQSRFETDYAVGHDMNEDSIPKSRRHQENAAGSMETTIADFTRFVCAVNDGKRLSSKSKEGMFSPQIGIYSKHQFPSLNNDTATENNSVQLSYGLGWGLFTSRYGKAFFKEGHGDGWTHYMISFPGKKAAYIFMTNSANGESIFKELTEKLTGATIPWQWEGYFAYRPTVKLPEKVLQQFVGEYEGKIKGTVTLENGQLKVESASTGLPKTNLYAINDHQFFLKVMATEMDFVRGPDGKISKVVLSDEGEHYELKKIK